MSRENDKASGTSPDALEKLRMRYQRRPIADLDDLRRALSCSGRTVFRALDKIGYHSSFSHHGRYYTLARVPRFDEQGLWFHDDVGFSVDGTLRATVERLVRDAVAGRTHEELQATLRLRVHDTLLDLVHDRRIARERFELLYVYVAGQPRIAKRQLARRQEQLEHERTAAAALAAPPPLDAARVIEVLLAVIRDRQADAARVAAALAARGLAVTEAQVEEIFARYGLEKKKTRSHSRRSPR
jgi:hypothetical protein